MLLRYTTKPDLKIHVILLRNWAQKLKGPERAGPYDQMVIKLHCCDLETSILTSSLHEWGAQLIERLSDQARLKEEPV
jgi:hypothetical protein